MPIELGLPIIQLPSPNFTSRKEKPIQFLVHHYTGLPTLQKALDLLRNPASPQVSAHFVVGEDGRVFQLVDLKSRAFHAGVSFWNGTHDLNWTSVGIEIANPGDTAFAVEQMKSVMALSKWIIELYRINPFNVVAHSDIAPDRKQDPGVLFPWPRLAAAGVGIFPYPLPSDAAESAGWTDAQIAEMLIKFGYNPNLALRVLLTAFQRHFQPEVFAGPEDGIGMPNLTTKAILHCLLRLKGIL